MRAELYSNLNDHSHPSVGISAELSAWAKSEGVPLNDLSLSIQNSLPPTVTEAIQRGLSEIRTEIGSAASESDVRLLYLDKRICEDTRLPAYKMNGIASLPEIRELAQGRVVRRAMEVIDMASKGTMIYGINTQNAITSIVSPAVGAVARGIAGRIENKNGTIISALIQRTLRPTRANARLSEALRLDLVEHGLDANVLGNAATSMYVTELGPHAERTFSNNAQPLLNAIAIVESGNPWGWLVAAVGSAAPYIGKAVYSYDKNVRKPASQYAAHVGVEELSKLDSKNHLRMVSWLRGASEIPVLLQAVVSGFRAQLGDAYTGTLIALVTGLSGYDSMLSSQRTHASRAQDVVAIERVLSYLGSDTSPLLSPWNWNKREGASVPKQEQTIQTGLVLTDFKPFFGSFPQAGITKAFERGNVYAVLGKSGIGKTAFVESIRRTVNYQGSVSIIEPGAAVGMRQQDYDSVRDQIVSISKESLRSVGSRVSDYMSDVFRSSYRNNLNNPIIVELHQLLDSIPKWQQDVLFYSAYDESQKVKNNPEIPVEIQHIAPAFFELKFRYTQELLARYIGKSEHVAADSFYAQLSKGQQQRVINAIISGYLLSDTVDVLILDEILEGLDEENSKQVLNDLNRMLKQNKKSPVIFWVSQTRQDLAKDAFRASYQEFDITTGLFHTEKNELLEKAVFYREDPIFTHWEIGSLSCGIKQMLRFVDLFSGFDSKAKEQFLIRLADQIESLSGLSADWKIYREYLCEQCGFMPDTMEILYVLADKGEIFIADDTDATYWSQALALHTWFNLPVFHWLDMDAINYLFGPMSPGDAIRFHARSQDNWEWWCNQRAMKSHKYGLNVWANRILMQTLNSYVSDLLRKPDEYWPIYKELLQQTLDTVQNDKSILVDKWFGFYITSALREQGQEFIDKFDMLMRNRWKIKQQASVPKPLHVFSTMLPAIYASIKPSSISG